MDKRVTCVFVHGWGMNSAVWEQCIAQLPAWVNVIVIDLPGHGTMADVTAERLDDYVHSLIPLVHQPVIWVGWSLGGLVVLRLAERFPERVAAAVLVSANPCFVNRTDWEHAVAADVFNQFADDLETNQTKTIRRFLALQVKGLTDAMQQVKVLQNSIAERGRASSIALSLGLRVLMETDARPVLQQIIKPLHWVLGDKDGLVPVSLAAVLTDEYKQQSVKIIEGASHAPFISHQEKFTAHLLELIENYRH